MLKVGNYYNPVIWVTQSKLFIRVIIMDIEKKIIEIAAETLKTDVSKITAQSSFVDDLKADSLDQVELMMAIEEAFSVDIPDEEASKITTIADAINYVKQKTVS
jgi:acyl carrier protein